MQQPALLPAAWVGLLLLLGLGLVRNGVPRGCGAVPSCSQGLLLMGDRRLLLQVLPPLNGMRVAALRAGGLRCAFTGANMHASMHA